MVTSSVESGISGAILAGGRARRMGGADKGALEIGGRRIIDRQLAELAAIAADVLIVANDTAGRQQYGARIVADRIAGVGPLGGLYTALLEARHETVLVIACDMPFVTRGLLARLAAELSPEDDAVMPRSARGLEPLCAAYRRRCAEVARAHIERGDLELARLGRDIRVRELGSEVLAPYGGDHAFENVNTPHDYARARSVVELNAKPFKDRITE
jgi:molybdopterin-guanine dinucleotide biosynthesis protein A